MCLLFLNVFVATCIVLHAAVVDHDDTYGTVLHLLSLMCECFDCGISHSAQKQERRSKYVFCMLNLKSMIQPSAIEYSYGKQNMHTLQIMDSVRLLWLRR